MVEVIGCFLNPGGCISNAMDAVLSLFPYGTLGMAFTAGLVIGAMIGKWGVGALIALVLAVKFGSRQHDDPVEHFERHPDHALAPRPRPGSIADGDNEFRKTMAEKARKYRRPHPSLSEALGKLFGEK